MQIKQSDELGDRLITQKQVSDKIALGRKWIWAKANQGAFPKPYKIGAARRWKLSEIDEWLAQQRK